MLLGGHFWGYFEAPGAAKTYYSSACFLGIVCIYIYVYI